MEAARLWALGKLTLDTQVAKEDDELNQVLAGFGIKAVGPAVAAQHEVFYLWPELEDTFYFFLECHTQWRVGLRGYSGLDYAGVEAFMRLRPVAHRKRQQLFADLRSMEQAALSAWHDQRSRQGR
ncbi:DUF1799 domain-containing protein [Rhodoferax aquaticus]|uniref:Uncharacterized protein n=1 Tax=Rhodoferax aquaticus TaxID=2527691 RepID=A0A515ERK9_9BURK|nr:DUF1799 domain-containing protein [Rhodoferax aquaticus]QDL55301.1 hypothetical protein EXZ61_14620 [Rhodoferax aquaticus]